MKPKPADNRITYILCLVILISLALRLFFFNQNPPGLNQDEAVNGYNAYSISETMRDSRGYLLPVLMHGFGNMDYRPPLYVYFSVPFMWIMGLSETSTRMAAVIFNVALIFIVFLLVRKMFNNKMLALFSAALLSMNPWHFHYSRVAHEAVLSPFFYFLSILLFYIALKEDRHKILFPIVGIIFGISVYTYPAARVLCPAIFIFMCAVFHKEAIAKARQVVTAAVCGLVVVFPLVNATLINPGELQSRMEQVSIFSGPNIIGTFLTNYFIHFSPDFLFFSGDSDNLPGMAGQYGMFQPYLAVLLVIGIIYLIYHLISIKDYRREILL